MQSPSCPVPEVTEKGSHKGKALKKSVPVRCTMMGSVIELRPTASQAQYLSKCAGVAPRFFASSQTCSKCNHRLAVSLKLSDRTFGCLSCGLVADRDLNAALNLERYCETTVVAPVTARRKTYALDLRKSFPQGMAGLPEGVNIASTLTGGVSAKQPVMVADGGD